MTQRLINKRPPHLNVKVFLTLVGSGEKVIKTQKNQLIFSRGDLSDAVFYILAGKVKLIVTSPRGKEAVVALLEQEAFFGEACLNGQRTRAATATCIGASKILRIGKDDMERTLHEEPAFSRFFLSYLLSRNSRVEEDLVDQIFNSSEKRLARILLLLAHFGKEKGRGEIVPKISQETLADMIGATRSRVSFFMNRFKRRGFIDYKSGLNIHSSLASVLQS